MDTTLALADFLLAVLVWLAYAGILALGMLSARALTHLKPRRQQSNQIGKPHRKREALCQTSSTWH